MKLLGKKTSYDKVLAFMKDELAESELTEHEQQMVIRWNEAFTLMRKFMSAADAAAILMKRFPGLSRATAYRDIANAISLFGDISATKKDGIRHLSTEMIKDAYAIALARNDADAMIKAAVAIAKVNGVNINDPDTFNWAELEPHKYVLGIDEKMQKALQSMIRGGKIDLTMFVDAVAAQADDATIILDEPKQIS